MHKKVQEMHLGEKIKVELIKWNFTVTTINNESKDNYKAREEKVHRKWDLKEKYAQ